MSWAYEVMVGIRGEKWYSNGVRFASKEEAENAAKDKYRAWTAYRDTRVVESTDPVNYTWKEGEGIKPIERLRSIASSDGE